MKTTLLIMAAGLGSRFGQGIKQLTPVGEKGELIMDYSIHDAVKAGFDHIVFVISRAIERDFNEVLFSRISSSLSRCGVTASYVLQDLHDIPGACPPGRTKPWGTGHAVLAARSCLDTPFAVINADDYYGASSFRLLHDHLVSSRETSSVAFRLEHTLSDAGAVTRGICEVSGDHLSAIDETRQLVRSGTGAVSNGRFFPGDTRVSMNMWGFSPSFLPLLQNGFRDFLQSLTDPLTQEFLIPVFIGELLSQGSISVRVIDTDETWFGMTYHDDIPRAREAIARLTSRGVYPADLYSDL